MGHATRTPDADKRAVNPPSPKSAAAALRLVHLAAPRLTRPTPAPGGLLSAHFRRYLADRRSSGLEARRIADRLVADARRHNPAGWLINGPLTCLGQPVEYHQARRWLESVAATDHVAVVPGGGDITAHANWSHTQQQWLPWICSDHGRGAAEPYPWWRQRGPAAIIGLPPWPAAEPVSRGRQMQRLEDLLQRAGQAGLCRIVLCQHAPGAPPGAGPAPAAGGGDWTPTLLAGGVELVLHGDGADWFLCTFRTIEGGALALRTAGCQASAGGGAGFYSVVEVARGDHGFRLDIARYRLVLPAPGGAAGEDESDLPPAERLDRAVFILPRAANR